MKKFEKSLRTISAFIVAAPALSGCFDLPDAGKTGTIQISIGERFISSTRGSTPDINDFILTVTDSKGNDVYNGSYCDSPDLIEVPAGSYTVSALSCPDGGPAFDRPQYGDTQVIVVPAGQCIAVQMICTQLNSGLKLSLQDSFIKAFPNGKLKFRSGSDEIGFDYDETRTAYFNPGNVSLLLDNDDTRETLFSRVLEPRRILAVNLSAVGGESAAGISVRLDTTRIWESEDFCFGSGGGDIDNALDISEAVGLAGRQGVWVFGYIAGSFNTSGGPSFTPPFNKTTNVVLSTRPGSTDKTMCLSVELKSGAMRDALNLKDNPANLGRGVFLKGDIVDAYYGMPGLKNASEFEWK